MKTMIKHGMLWIAAAFSMVATGCADVDDVEAGDDEDVGESVLLLQLPAECSKQLPFNVNGAARLTGIQLLGSRISSATGIIKNPYGGKNKARVYLNGKQIGSGSGLPSNDEFAVETTLTKVKKGDKIEMSFSFDHVGADSKCVAKTTY